MLTLPQPVVALVDSRTRGTAAAVPELGIVIAGTTIDPAVVLLPISWLTAYAVVLAARVNVDVGLARPGAKKETTVGALPIDTVPATVGVPDTATVPATVCVPEGVTVTVPPLIATEPALPMFAVTVPETVGVPDTAIVPLTGDVPAKVTEPPLFTTVPDETITVPELTTTPFVVPGVV
jgi:hypothetical protein